MVNIVRVLIIDDDLFARRGLKAALSENFGSVAFGGAGTGQEALESWWNKDWDVVLLDISMPGRSGLEVLKKLRTNKPKTPVIVLSMHDEMHVAIRVLKLGACSYIHKNSGHELVKGVEAALRGTRYITPAIAERLALPVEKEVEGPAHYALSNREFQVMRLLACGETVKEIGGLLSLGVKTISTYRARILKKIGIRNNLQIMHYALRHGLLDAGLETLPVWRADAVMRFVA